MAPKRPAALQAAKAKRLSTKKAPKQASWKSLGGAAYADLLRCSGHFSSKTVNSNAQPTGVRLSTKDRLPLPYVAVSTVRDLSLVPVDYLRNAAEAGAMKQIAAVFQGTHAQDFVAPDPEEVAIIESLLPSTAEPALIGGNHVDIRLRQVLLPTGDGTYLAVTPLQSAGFSHFLAGRLEAEREQLKALKAPGGAYRRRAILGIGGANPQNVGRYVRAMQRPTVFSAPAESLSVRRARAIHHRGIALLKGDAAVLAYCQWRHAWKNERSGSLKSRQAEAALLEALARSILERAEDARVALDEHIDYLVTRTDERLNPFMRMLLDPELRSRTWPNDFADHVLRQLATHQYRLGGETYTVGNEDDLLSQTNMLKEVAR